MMADQMEQRRAAVAESKDLAALLATVRRRVAPLLERAPIIPEVKALLSIDGGVCPDDGAPLAFDPWSAERHRCIQCGKTTTGERQHRYWARYQHLWIAERAADLATVSALTGDEPAAARAREILQAYGARYFSYPNRDNVLGPARLLFSTYLESIWILSYLAAATTLRAHDALDEPTERAVSLVADEAANLIGEFDERFSNRQTWNNAALAAIAVWFGDEELLQRAVMGQTGLAAQLAQGFRGDGLWYEGENYHLFALRGLLTGLDWARAGATNFLENKVAVERLGLALLAPAFSALPDATFPARKDSRFGVSLAQPMYLDTWEVALGLLPDAPFAPDLAAWLRHLYGTAPAAPQVYESFLHDAPFDAAPLAPSRGRLSSWALREMPGTLPEGSGPWQPASVLLADQGLAILRSGDRYVSLEAGPWGGGHGHPDRLHLTLHNAGVHWLPDPGTGSYVEDTLFWYRSTLAHNAPRVDGVSQTMGRATCERFEENDHWSWTLGRFIDLTRMVVAGPGYIIDVVEITGQEQRLLELPWHLAGEVMVDGGGWTAGELDDRFVSDVERLVPGRPGPIVLRATKGDAQLGVHLVIDGELLRMRAPGLPVGRAEPATFFLARGRGKNMRWFAVLETTMGAVRDVRASGDTIEIVTAQGTDRHRATGDSWIVESASWRGTLRGPQDPRRDYTPLLELEPPERATGSAFRIGDPPALDGSDAGFPLDEPLTIDLEDQYRRSEEAYPGPEELSATAAVAWDETALYVYVDVTKPEHWFRAADAPPLLLDNDPDDIHSDGIQVYVGDPDGDGFAGVLAVPEPDGSMRVRAVRTSTAGANIGGVHGTWQETDHGYSVTLAFAWPEWARPHVGSRVGFDLIVNEMLPDRQRRAGQLAWSGGNGWVWLRGDGQAKERLGELELVG